MNIAVTGAAGHLGRLIIDTLITRGTAPGEITAIVRNPEKAADLADRGITLAVADYSGEAALTAALTGVERLIMVSASEIGQRVDQHRNIINAAKTAGVDFIVYTSLLNAETSTLPLAEEHRPTEALLAESGIDHALLRNGWYWENFASALDSGRAAGVFVGAAGSGRVSGAARRDYAEAAAIVATTAGHAGRVYELAGAPALSYPEIAEAVGEVLGTEVTYVNQSEREYRKTLEEAGMPAPVAEVFAGMEPLIGAGALYSESRDLQELLGRESTSAVEALRAL